MVNTLAFCLLDAVTLPILVGGKVYNMMQFVMTTKIAVVLGFCTIVVVTLVSAENWGHVFGGFFKFGNVPIVAGEDRNENGQLDEGEDFDRDGHLDTIEPIYRKDAYGNITEWDDIDKDGKWDGENVDNVVLAYYRDGEFPTLFLAQIALLGAFAGYAGGGGLGNSTYSNFRPRQRVGHGQSGGRDPQRRWWPKNHAQPHRQGLRHQQ